MISGDRAARVPMEAQTLRRAFYDGRLADLGSAALASFIPLISDNWTNHFTWRGVGAFPDAERQKLTTIMQAAHSRGQRVRFWATPDLPGPERDALWTELVAAETGQRIALKVAPEVSQLSESGAIVLEGFSIPSLTTRRAETSVELASGQSLAIAGLIQNNMRTDAQKYPGLGDIPILGALFRSTSFKRAETELVIIVTPYLVRGVSVASRMASPTEGYRAPTDPQLFWEGQTYTGRSGQPALPPAPAPAVGGAGAIIAPGVAPVNGANSDVKWETTTESNVGIDAGFLDGRLNLTADWFKKRTTDILIAVPVGAVYGLNAPTQNAGIVENNGWEFTAGYNDRKGDFSWNATGNVSFINNKVVKFVSVDISGYTIKTAGLPINSLWGYVAEGIFQTQEEIAAHAKQSANTRPGDLKYQDLNGDKVIDTKDRQYLGNYYPKVTYGLNLADMENLGCDGILPRELRVVKT